MMKDPEQTIGNMIDKQNMCMIKLFYKTVANIFVEKR